MTKIDKTVLKETKYIAVWVFIFSLLMQAVFVLLNSWKPSVLYGNLLSGIAVVVNFLLMGITVQKAVVREEKAAKALIKLSQMYRLLFMLIVVVIGAAAPCFDLWAVCIPVVFPRIAIALRPLFDRR